MSRRPVDVSQVMDVVNRFVADGVAERTHAQSVPIQRAEDALRDALAGLEAVQRNMEAIKGALNKAGLPSSWLDSIQPKIVRAKDALWEEP